MSHRTRERPAECLASLSHSTMIVPKSHAGRPRPPPALTSAGSRPLPARFDPSERRAICGRQNCIARKRPDAAVTQDCAVQLQRNKPLTSCSSLRPSEPCTSPNRWANYEAETRKGAAGRASTETRILPRRKSGTLPLLQRLHDELVPRSLETGPFTNYPQSSR
ncbi:hypothetical protein EVAR_4801_1 [Eumeta japonica]|uniref:Uncharacterized protein n=1 Tax=Eumeta variegata TaxID=151549 RepID=A0A4C1T1V0_EUMVA|nr:hypothetical protein EVAR_4801_1 [Eumeta japonica]